MEGRTYGRKVAATQASRREMATLRAQSPHWNQE